MNDNTKEDVKQCSECGISKPATSLYFEKGNKEGSLRNKCIDCRKEYRRNYYKKYNEVNKEYVRKRNSEYGKKYHKTNLETNPEEYRKKKRIQANKIYHQKNEEMRKYHRDYYKVNRAKILESKQVYREENREQVRFVLKKAKYKRRAIMKTLPSTLTKSQWDSCKKHFNCECAYCGNGVELTMDHFLPISKEGGTTVENIIPSCHSCNSSKSNKDFQKWYQEQSFYDKERENKIMLYIKTQSAN